MAKGTSRAWFLVPAVAVLLAVWTLLSARSSTQPRGGLEGAQRGTVTLRAPSGGGRDAGPRLVERLVAIGVDARLLDATDDRVRVELRRVSDPLAAIEAASSPEPISFFLIDPSQQGHAAAEVPDGGGDALLRPWRNDLTRADLRDGGVVAPEGLAPLLECIPDARNKGARLCAAWLGAPAPVAGRHVAEVHLGADRRTEEPLVTVRFTEEGARALEAAARDPGGRLLAVVAFGEVQARPPLDAPVAGGTWTFSTRTGDTARPTAIDRAQRIAAAAKLPPLPPLQVERVE